jgi:SAM-dependent methyltransferase
MSIDARLFSPAAARNRDPILAVLKRDLPKSGLVLEIASGSGEHVSHFAAALPSVQWQPSDEAAACRACIDAWAHGLANVRPAITLDAAAPDWPIEHADAVLCINMIHIAPWKAATGLMSGASRILAPSGLLALYGPYRSGGQTMEVGNAAFDADLKSRNPEWGLRVIEDVAALAADSGFGPPLIMAMPADNRMLLFRRQN